MSDSVRSLRKEASCIRGRPLTRTKSSIVTNLAPGFHLKCTPYAFVYPFIYVRIHSHMCPPMFQLCWGHSGEPGQITGTFPHGPPPRQRLQPTRFQFQSLLQFPFLDRCKHLKYSVARTRRQPPRLPHTSHTFSFFSV